MFGQGRAAVVVVATLALVVAGVLAVLARPPAAPVFDDGEPLTRAEVAELVPTELPHWQAFRRQLGFDSSAAVVEQLALSPEGVASLSQMGAPLSNDELLEVQRREMALQREPEVRARLGARYGGLFLDHLHGGSVVVLHLGELHRAEIDRVVEVFDAGTNVVLREVEHSYGELVAAQRRLAGSMTDLDFAEVGVDVESGEIVAGVVALSADDDRVDRARALGGDIDIRFEDSPPVQTADCTSRWSCGSGPSALRGGLRIASASGNCTSGFVASQTNGNDYLITAGHCDRYPDRPAVSVGGETSGSGIDFRFMAGRNALRDGDGNWVSATSADAVLIGIDDANKSNRIYRFASLKGWVVNAKQTGAPARGQIVCIAAIVTRYRCGVVADPSVITNPGASTPYTGVFTEQVKFDVWVPGDVSTLEGSSGGPIIGANVFGTQRYAMGVASGEKRSGYDQRFDTTRFNLYFSTVDNIERALNVEVRLTD